VTTGVVGAIGTMLGLALGDAYGRPLEFIGDDDVRTAGVTIEPGTFMWTDDTHMALYLARAVNRPASFVNPAGWLAITP